MADDYVNAGKRKTKKDLRKKRRLGVYKKGGKNRTDKDRVQFNSNLGMFSIITSKILRIKGPRINPINPKICIPPRIPINITTGCIFDFPPTSFNLTIEST